MGTFVTAFWFWPPIPQELEAYRVQPEHSCARLQTAMGATVSGFSRSGPEESIIPSKVEDCAEGLKQDPASYV